MGGVNEAFRMALDDGNVLRLRKMWGSLHPDMPQPESYEEAEIALHYARTGANSIRVEKRLYSYMFLVERQMPHQLPEKMKPKHDRRDPPVIASAVGVSVGTTSSRQDRKDEAKALEKVMGDAAGFMITMGVIDRERIVAYMWAARDAFITDKIKREI